MSSSSHQPGILTANQQAWLPGNMEELVCEELLTPSHELAVRLLKEICPVQWKHVPGCAVSEVQQMQCVFCECFSAFHKSAHSDGEKKKKFAWKIPKHPDWLCIKKCDSIMLYIPSLGCNLIPDLNNLSLLDKGSGSLPWFPYPH